MKNKKILAILALTMSLSCVMTACSFGGDEPEQQVIVEETPTPEPTKEATPTPTITPDGQSTTYTSSSKTISIKLPDATWANKSDEVDMVSFESPEQGKILILHGAGEEDMSSAVIPSTEDMANSLEKASGYEPIADYEIRNYTSEVVDNVNVYTYTVKYNNTEKTDGIVYTINKVYTNDQEFYSIAASIKKDDETLLSKIQESVSSFQILGDSALKSAAPGTTDAANGQANVDGTAAGEATTDGTVSGTTAADGTTAGTSTGSTKDRFTDAQLSDTSQTRTIYRNSDGKALVITPDGNGSWVDFDGNTYSFANDEDVYDQNGVDYYYHGEAADVYYMPVE